MNIHKVIYLLVVPLWTTLLSVEAKVTFYYDRNEWRAALGDANIVQNIARRSIKNPQTWNERAENKALPFQQCDLTFLPDDTCEGCSHKNWMQIWNYQLPEIASFNDADAYSFRVGGNFAQNRKIEAAHQFYAVGFDHLSKGQGNKFTIKVFDDEAREYTSNLANRGQKAKFYGWITDNPEEATNMFEISHVNNNVIHFMYTNIAYATYDDSAVTQVGCYITDAATRSCSATGWGDPHFSTFDNYMYDVHVKGEVTLAKSMNTTFEIQGRLEGVGQTTLGGPAVTTGVVVQEKTPDLPSMQVSVASSSSDTATRFNISRVDHVTGEIEYHECPVELFVDGVPKDMSIGTGRSDARARVIGNKVVVEYPSTNLRLDMTVNYFRKCLFSVDYLLADCRPQETLIGILGSPDEKWSNDWMTRDGTALELPEDSNDRFFKPAYEYVVENWCIRDPAASLFTYEGGENFYTYAHCGNAYDPTLEEVVAAGTSVELSMCEEDDLGCKIEVLTLGTEAAEAYLEDPAHDLTYIPTKAPTTPPTPYPTPEPTISPTPGPTSNPTPTPGPTSQPTPGPTLLDQSRAEDINGCPISSKDIIVGSEFGKKCGHKGIGLVTTSPRELLTFEGDNFLELSSLNDIFYDIRTNDSQVSFQAKNPFDDKVDMYVRYEAEYEASDHTIGHPRFATCEATPDVERCDTLDVGPLEAGCVVNHKTGESYAVVDVYFVDKSNSLFPFEIESSPTVDECCHPTGTEGATVALYSFFIMCTCPSFNPDGNVDVRTDGTDDVDDTKPFAVAAIDTQPPTPTPTPAPTPSPTPSPITDFPSLSPSMTEDDEECIAENISQGKTATQSSTFHVGNPQASKALDGDNTTIAHTHCGEEQPWWRVDLGKDQVYEVTRVDIINRLDCCWGRLKNFVVEVLDKNLDVVASEHYGGTVGPVEITFDFLHENTPPSGQYVQIRLLGTDCLQLAEVNVYGFEVKTPSPQPQLINLSSGKQASQSTTYHGSIASFALDGDDNSISHTKCNTGESQWWRMDLVGEEEGDTQVSVGKSVSQVIITNRQDCCWTRLNNFVVEILDENLDVVDTVQHLGPMGKVTQLFVFPHNPIGRYVQIRLLAENSDCLQLAEVHVFGYATENAADGDTPVVRRDRRALRGVSKSPPQNGSLQPFW